MRSSTVVIGLIVRRDGFAARLFKRRGHDWTERYRGGVQGFIEWLALNEPKTAAALFARVMPYFISTDGDAPDVASEAELNGWH
jgi:hypothetical protein